MINKERLNNFRFADDTVLITENANKLKEMIQALKDERKRGVQLARIAFGKVSYILKSKEKIYSKNESSDFVILRLTCINL